MIKRKCADCYCVITPENQGKWSPYFCQSCDKKRMDRVTASMKKIAEKVGIPYPGEDM